MDPAARAYDIARLAAEQLTVSAELLAQVMRLAAEGAESNRAVVAAIRQFAAVRQPHPGADGGTALPAPGPASTRDSALAAARRSAQLVLAMRAMIGGKESHPLQHLWAPRRAGPTMVDVQMRLGELHEQACRARPSDELPENVIASIRQKIVTMQAVSRHNNAVALDAAGALEKMQSQATDFVRILEREALSP
jgi:hypothetical protein